MFGILEHSELFQNCILRHTQTCVKFTKIDINCVTLEIQNLSMPGSDVSRVFLQIGRQIELWKAPRWLTLNGKIFKNLCLQMVEKCTLRPCVYLNFFVKYLPNNLNLHYETLIFVDDFERTHIYIWYSNKKFV